MDFEKFLKKTSDLLRCEFRIDDNDNWVISTALGSVDIVKSLYGRVDAIDMVFFRVRGHELQLKPESHGGQPMPQDFQTAFDVMELMVEKQSERLAQDQAGIERYIAELEKVRKAPVNYVHHNGQRPACEVLLANSDYKLMVIHGDHIRYKPSKVACEAHGVESPGREIRVGSVQEMMMTPVTDRGILHYKFNGRRGDIFVSEARWAPGLAGEIPCIIVGEKV